MNAENVAHAEMGMSDEERSKYWAGHLTIAPTGPENVVGLKAVMLQEIVEEPFMSPDIIGRIVPLDDIINLWAKENWKTYNVVRLDYLPGTPRAVMLYVARIQSAEVREELWDIGEAVHEYVKQYLAKKHELELKGLELKAAEEKAQHEKAEADRKEVDRLAELGRSHEANCGKAGKKARR